MSVTLFISYIISAHQQTKIFNFLYILNPTNLYNFGSLLLILHFPSTSSLPIASNLQNAKITGETFILAEVMMDNTMTSDLNLGR